MKELMKKYGYFNIHHGNLYISVSDKKEDYKNPDLTDVVISFSNNVIIMTATLHYYTHFSSFFKYDWKKSYEEYYDLEGRTINDITRVTWLLRRRVLKGDIILKKKKTEEIHYESSNWTLKILDFETGNLLKSN